MSEVGKVYRRNGYEYICIFADDSGGLLRHAGSNVWKNTFYRREYTEVKPKIKVDVWINVYPNGKVFLHHSKQEAEQERRSAGHACLHVVQEVEEGEGL